MKVFVFTSRSIESWQEKVAKDDSNPFNHSTPYGYGNFTKDNDSVEIISEIPKNSLQKKIIKIIPFSLLKVFLINYNKIVNADVIWTHTEKYTLFLAFLNKFRIRKLKIVGQFVWLIDRWDAYNKIEKKLIKWLIKNVDVVFLHSPNNFNEAEKLFPKTTFKLVKYGVKISNYKIERNYNLKEPFTVIAVGNDRHRDWKTFINALKLNPKYKGIIVSKTVPVELISSLPENVEIKNNVSDHRELLEIYENAHVLVVPLIKNKHASGITVVEEGIINNIPTVLSNSGGVEYYFDNSIVNYYNEGNEKSLSTILNEIETNYSKYFEKSKNGVDYLIRNKITSKDYIEEYWNYSRKIMR